MQASQLLTEIKNQIDSLASLFKDTSLEKKSAIKLAEESEKDKWIKEKIALLIGEGKGPREATAIANSMWEKDHKQIPDLQPLPILSLGETMNPRIKITKEILSDVQETFNPEEHLGVPLVIGPHDKEDLEPKAWFTRLYPKEVKYSSGKTREWLYGDYRPVDEKAAAEIKEALSKLKGNSLEAYPASDLPEYASKNIRAAIDGKKDTADWIEELKNRHVLTRVNLVPNPAQFGQQGAILSKTHKGFLFIQLANGAEESIMEEKACPKCGMKYSDDSNYCPADGEKLMAEKEVKEMTDEEKAAADKAAIEKESADKAAEATLAEKLKAAQDQIATMAAQLSKQKEKASDAEKTKAEVKELQEAITLMRKRERHNEIVKKVDQMIADGEMITAHRDRAIQLAESYEANIGSDVPVKLSKSDGTEGDEESPVDFVLEGFRLPEKLIAGPLQVMRLSESGSRPKEGQEYEAVKLSVKKNHPELDERQVIRIAQEEYAKKVAARGGR